MCGREPMTLTEIFEKAKLPLEPVECEHCGALTRKPFGGKNGHEFCSNDCRSEWEDTYGRGEDDDSE